MIVLLVWGQCNFSIRSLKFECRGWFICLRIVKNLALELWPMSVWRKSIDSIWFGLNDLWFYFSHVLAERKGCSAGSWNEMNSFFLCFYICTKRYIYKATDTDLVKMCRARKWMIYGFLMLLITHKHTYTHAHGTKKAKREFLAIFIAALCISVRFVLFK